MMNKKTNEKLFSLIKAPKLNLEFQDQTSIFEHTPSWDPEAWSVFPGEQINGIQVDYFEDHDGIHYQLKPKPGVTTGTIKELIANLKLDPDFYNAQILGKDRCNHLILVQCSKSKSEYNEKAKELYTSDLFTKSYHYGLSLYEPGVRSEIMILSAEHGLVDPDERLDPYDQALSNLTRQERRDWSQSVYAQLKTRYCFALPDRITFLAGKCYREDLEHLVREYDGVKTEAPLQGLGIGEQLQKLTELSLRSGKIPIKA